MTDKFKPLDHSPRLVYGADYWSIVAQDTATKNKENKQRSIDKISGHFN